MIRVLFHINEFNERGTSYAVYKYAHYNETILGNLSYIICPKQNEFKNTKEFFEHRFTSRVFGYQQFTEVDKIIQQYNIHIFYALTSGYANNKHVISKLVPSCEHVVFPNKISGTKRKAYISEWVSIKMSKGKIPFVPLIVELPNVNENMRKELGISYSTIVFGRHGGWPSFQDKDGIEAVIETAKTNPNIIFIFVNTKPFSTQISNIKYLPSILFGDEIAKTRFINTCDAMIHARIHGECFGLAVAEFSIRNKPVITNSNGRDKAHIHMLGKKAIQYNDKKSLMEIFRTFKRNVHKDWNAFQQYTPALVMKKFERIFLW